MMNDDAPTTAILPPNLQFTAPSELIEASTTTYVLYHTRVSITRSRNSLTNQSTHELLTNHDQRRRTNLHRMRQEKSKGSTLQW